MKKEVGLYLFIVLIVLVGLSIIFVDFKSTGFIVLTEEDCETADYTWEEIVVGEDCVNITVEDCGEECTEICENVTILCECLESVNDTCVDPYPCEDEIITNCTETCIDVNCTNQTSEQCEDIIEGKCTCTASTCSDLGKECGTHDDGCGITIDCGDCGSGDECDSGSCVEIKETEGTPVELPEELPVIPEVLVELPTPELSIQGMDSLILNPLDSKSFNLIATNTGALPLTACVLIAGGESASWISIPDESKNFNVGEQQSFSFSVNVPEDVEEREYSSSLSVKCSELSRTSDFVIQVIKKRVDFNLTKVERTRKDRVRVSYLLKDLSGEEQTVYLQFSLFDANNQQVSNASENHTLVANASKQFRVNVPVNETFEGNLTLSVSLNSKEYSSSVQEPITLGSPTGFLIFEDIGPTGNVAVVIGLALIAIAVFFILKRVKHPKESK